MALALEILRLPILELQAFLERQMEDNPCLEVDEQADDSATLAGAAESDPAAPDLREEWLAHWAEAERDDADERDGWDGDLAATRQSLYETLLRQLGCQPMSEEQRRLALLLIDHLDAAGYLEGSLEALAAEASATVEALGLALRMIQRFEPAGVGARNLQECLLLQLDARQAACSLAYRIVRDHFPLFLEGRLPVLANALGVFVEEARAACEQLRRLNPKPGAACSSEVPAAVVPDLVVRHRERHYDVELNDHDLPALRLSRVYARMLKDPHTPPDAREFLSAKSRQAGWVIKAIDERNATLLAIGRCLISLQREFLDQGPGALRPLTQAQVAALIGRHPSTVSRAVASKTIDTPYGVFPLEQLFATTVPQDAGGSVSDEQIKAEIRELIAQEDSHRALSDSALANRLAQRRITVARRTIAKYRTLLRIPPAHLRRRSL